MPRLRTYLTLLLLALGTACGAQQVSADSLLAEAHRHVGTPYRWAGTSPKGFDCAGFTRYVFGRFGIDLPHSSAAQYPTGVHVERGQWRPGDLVFFSGRAIRDHIGHVGIVVEADSVGFRFIHASVGRGVLVSRSSEAYYSARYRGACRLLDPGNPEF